MLPVYKLLIDTSFKNANNFNSKINDEIIQMDGMSGTKTRHLYNNLLNFYDARYLEIGTWKGSSVCSAMFNNKAKVVCIDNWCGFGGPKNEFIENFNKFKGENEAQFIETDCFDYDVSTLPKFNIYMYDGGHSLEDHYNALKYYYDCLDDIFIFIVDDWNWWDVREGTYRAINDCKYTILYQKGIRTSFDNQGHGSKDWWNGIYVAILQKNKIISNNTISLKFNYFSNSSELCNIGKKYDTDKSSQRNDVSDIRHCHPYTLFYDSLFSKFKNEKLNIAELGILYGGSLLMWREYFKNSNIYGFEYNNDLINRFKKNFNNNRITLSNIDVTNEDSIKTAFKNLDIYYDIIIDDTTHQFDDQIRLIENTYQYLKPGGLLIIEDIYRSYDENKYIERLEPILKYFKYYFIDLEHERKNSTGWDNDKLFILVKNNNDLIQDNKNKITIITPCMRIDNLLKMYKSLDFNYIDEWIIVYDGNKVDENFCFFRNQNYKIKEYCTKGDGISGNDQRNYALTKVTNENTILYYLDDDNIIHSDLYKLLDVIDNNKIYTFNQYNRIRSNKIEYCHIDTAMFLVPYMLCKNIKWKVDIYQADYQYIKECVDNNPNTRIYVDNDLCYYNEICNNVTL